MSKFKNEYGEDDPQKIIENYPDRVPVIITLSKDFSKNYVLDKSKYIVPNDLALGQLVYMLRKKLKLEAEKAVFVYINNKLIENTETMKAIYDKHKHTNGFLYIELALESTFG